MNGPPATSDGKRAAALASAARGFRCFPLRANGKLPKDGMGWTLHASSDPDVVRSMWTDPFTGAEHDYNIGFLTNDHIVIDIDVKDQKQGLKTALEDLELYKSTLFPSRIPEFDTLTVRTPSGGYHLIYKGVDHLVGNAHLISAKDGIDVKSFHGYVAAPGSTIDGRGYEIVRDILVAPFPEHLRHLLKEPRQRTNNAISIEEDLPEAISIATHYLQRDAPPAIQGSNGDDTAFAVGCRIRDFGVSEETALELFLDKYNSRCQPPWNAGEARIKIENAYRYAKGAAGSASPAAIFEDVHIIPLHASPTGEGFAADRKDGPEVLESKKRNRFELTAFRDISFSTGQRWLVKGLLAASGLAVIFGAKKEYKSFIALDLGLHIAAGKPWAGKKVNRGAVVFIAAEGANGFADRVAGNRQKFKLRADLPFYLMKAKPNLGVGAGERDELIAAIAPTIDSIGIPVVAIFIDTLVRTLAGSNENDEGMRNFCDNAEALAEHFGCLAVAVHHVGKDASRGMRGSSALGGAVVTSWRVEKTAPLQARVSLEDAKDGESGLTWLVDLERYVYGRDEDGDEETVLLVREVSEPVPTGGTKAAPDANASRPPPPQLKLFMDCLESALFKGQYAEPCRNGVVMKVVALKAVRTEYFTRRGDEATDAAKRTSFNNQVKNAFERRLVETAEIDTETVVWKTLRPGL